MSDRPSMEKLARRPWLAAEPETWWEVTGCFSPTHTFERCTARALPGFITGTDEPHFEVLIYGDPVYVKADAITHARQLVLVYADEYDDLKREVAA